MTLEVNTSVTAPTSFKKRILLIGPGFVAAATGVGTGDLVASLVAGAGFGLVFIWAIIVGAILKHFLNEGVGRWHLATGKTILEGWQEMGKWATGYFGAYTVIWGFVYGAAATSACALAMSTMFPIMPFWAWAIIHGIVGFLLIWTGRYQIFEKVMMVLIGLMFVTVIGSAALFLPHLGDFAKGFVPTIPEGSFMLALGLIGGVGGTITMASYGYWLKEKGWSGKEWIPTMRLDSKAAYIMTAVFTLSLLIVGSQFLYGTGINVKGEQGLFQLTELLGHKYGPIVSWLFLIGFWSAAFSSLLGVWNGVPYLFADFVRIVRKQTDRSGTEKDPAYRIYLAWLTFPPMLLLFFGKPVQLIILYGALGALFMPFLSFSLIWLLNKKVEKDYRSSLASNIVLTACILLFAILAVSKLISIF
ncbi:Nramp family divalent metal transporter [Falsibacillus albus]|uniref:Divalent metal cation transporter n=1 Tax=Falsibacillus albus TaxID=2478915 RepID=A0A3L7JUT7_9BACI|nr:Nramp family divalent metal transporter [Falsibacillus albus]RLQ94014.1 divalent metal cation transporter [Falsibacillus albus]